MENASKGLLIAAAVLIVILIVTISIKILDPVEGTKEKAEEIGETMSGASQSAVGKLQSSLDGTSTMPKAEVDKKTDKNSTINGKKYSSKNPIIPAGFMPINTRYKNNETYEDIEAKWDAEGGPEVDKGLVISDGNSEFVWVPVTKKIEAY